jgi:hypothetical protein
MNEKLKIKLLDQYGIELAPSFAGWDIRKISKPFVDLYFCKHVKRFCLCFVGFNIDARYGQLELSCVVGWHTNSKYRGEQDFPQKVIQSKRLELSGPDSPEWNEKKFKTSLDLLKAKSITRVRNELANNDFDRELLERIRFEVSNYALPYLQLMLTMRHKMSPEEAKKALNII